MGGKQLVDSIDSREFRKFMGDTGLIDLGYLSYRFTRCNNRSGIAIVWERMVGLLVRQAGCSVSRDTKFNTSR